MKVVFLDIDGVLNGTQNFGRPRTARGHGELNCWIDMIDPLCVTLLNALCSATHAQVVVSSSWRRALSVDELRTVLMAHGFTGQVIGRTQHHASGEPREQQIRSWLAEHSEVTSFVILEDCEPMGRLWRHLVRTDPSTGLVSADVILAAQILNKQHKRA